jgi:hypothetical protein
MNKKLLTILSVCLLFFACNSSDDNTEETSTEVTNETSVDTVTVNNSSDSALTVTSSPLIWTVDEQNPENEKMIKPHVRLDTFSSANLVQLINKNYPDIHLDLLKVSHDTMYVKIPESKKLTQEMGSTGAQNYMASATYTLTEFKNVKYVNFDMKEGDHAGPGVFSREDFKTMR